MTKARLRKLAYAAILGIVLAAGLFALRPKPLHVDIGRVEQGSMQVTVDEEGKTRCHDRFVITAPVSGNLARITLREGDPVKKQQVLALIAPVPLSARERDEQKARIAAAEDVQHSAEELVHRAQADLAQAKRESQRVDKLVKEGFMSQQTADRAHTAETTLTDELDAARYRASSAAADVRLAKSGLIADRGGKGALFRVRSPVSGRVLRITDRSERVVAAGAALLTLGDLNKLEGVVELLSSEAVKVRPGMPVILENWGGSEPLHARVRLVEPYAYTKVSALGVEEQRTNVILDLVDPPPALGDGYRVDAHIIIWSRDNVLKIPASALYRCEKTWCAFTVHNGRARQRAVSIGERNDQVAQVLRGLIPGDIVILHPANDVQDGSRVAF
ncbi:MAG TPA: efflux RND transporter periplasmic adaptor subunit [Gallionellaceae bacterium]|nr:efflux RND transporter periplasmic adaptor subunit [Gallionellaceae bacterium]